MTNFRHLHSSGNTNLGALKAWPNQHKLSSVFLFKRRYHPMVMRPLEPHELLERCDLAGEARVLEVTRNPTGSGQIARLCFTKTAKGRVQRFRKEKRNVAVVALRGSTRNSGGGPILGEWSDFYEPGTMVFTHLDWDAATGAYHTSWWNAISPVEQACDKTAGFWPRLKLALASYPGRSRKRDL